MLERLGDTRWDDTHHAYGPAGDTPSHIRDLTSPLASVRRRALDQLIGSICHQGTVYSATARAVPFLIEVAAQRSVPDRAGVLELLSIIAESTGHPDKPGREPLEWLDDLRHELRAGVGMFIDLLRDEGPAVRLQAINLLSRLPDERKRTLPYLYQAATGDAEPSIRATAIVAVARMSEQRDNEAIGVLRRAFETDPSASCRAAAAVLGLPRIEGTDRAEMAAACIVIAVGALEDLGDPPPNVESWEGAALSALRRADIAVSDEDLSKAADLLERRRRASFEHAHALLDVAFGGGRAPSSAADLTPGQRKAVEAVAAFAFPRAWTIWGNYADALAAVGLPNSEEGIVRYLGGRLPWRVLDRRRKPFSWKFW